MSKEKIPLLNPSLTASPYLSACLDPVQTLSRPSLLTVIMMYASLTSLLTALLLLGSQRTAAWPTMDLASRAEANGESVSYSRSNIVVLAILKDIEVSSIEDLFGVKRLSAGAHIPGCEFVGTAPACYPKHCPRGMKLQAHDGCGTGKCCLTGRKWLCCKPPIPLNPHMDPQPPWDPDHPPNPVPTQASTL